MSQLSDWGQEMLTTWNRQASALQKAAIQPTIAFASVRARASADVTGAACLAVDRQVRAKVQKRIADVCEAMCKEVGAYPKCTCPDFAKPDATPDETTWEELLVHMDNLAKWSEDKLKAWKNSMI